MTVLDRAVKGLQSWGAHLKGKRGTRQPVFIYFDRTDGESIYVGYGVNPPAMSASVGVPIGFSFYEHGNERSYLVLAFANDWSGTEIARHLGGPVHSYRMPIDEVDEHDAVATAIKTALGIAKRSKER